MKMKTDMTPQQAITLYKTIEALIRQFDRENDPVGKGDCAACCAENSVEAYHCSKCGYNGSPKGKNTYAAAPNIRISANDNTL